MESVQELIRQKLAVALQEQRKRVAEKLFEVIQPAATAPATPSGGANAATKTADPGAVAAKKKAKMDQINALRAKIAALQGKASTAKDPTAMRQQLQAQQQKLTTMQAELSAIK